MIASVLYPVTVDARRIFASQLSISSSLSSIEVHIFEIKGVYVARDISKDRKTDVDTQVCTTACNHCNANRWD